MTTESLTCKLMEYMPHILEEDYEDLKANIIEQINLCSLSIIEKAAER